MINKSWQMKKTVKRTFYKTEPLSPIPFTSHPPQTTTASNSPFGPLTTPSSSRR